MWVMSSKLMVAPSLDASTNSSAGVLLEENMISPPENPHFCASSSSVREEQSTPQPSWRRIFRMVGLGLAFTAKYCLNPGFHEKARSRARAFARIPFSS